MELGKVNDAGINRYTAFRILRTDVLNLNFVILFF